MHLGRNDPCYVDNDPLQSGKQHKVLGMIIDSNLKFHTHTPTVDNKANKVLGTVASTSISLCEVVKY